MEKSRCKVLFLKTVDDDGGVTVVLKVLGLFVYVVLKLLKVKGQEMHEQIWRLDSKLRNDKF